jgi:hypothetical protein
MPPEGLHMPVNRDALSIKPSSMFNVVRIKASPGCLFVCLYMPILYAVVKHLYKALAPGAKPRYDTVLKVLRALGVKLNVESVHV